MNTKAKFFIVTFISIFLVSCGNQAPLTEAQQAEKYNMTIEEFKEMKDAAARMNMTIQEHMNMTDTNHDTMQMDMGDDSHMLEDEDNM